MITNSLLALFYMSFCIPIHIIWHELGHYVVARLTDIPVHQFSIFGKPKWSMRKGSVLLTVGTNIYIGGHVEVEWDSEVSYARLRLIAIGIAGAAFNGLAVLVFTVMPNNVFTTVNTMVAMLLAIFSLCDADGKIILSGIIGPRE